MRWSFLLQTLLIPRTKQTVDSKEPDGLLGRGFPSRLQEPQSILDWRAFSRNGSLPHSPIANIASWCARFGPNFLCQFPVVPRATKPLEEAY